RSLSLTGSILPFFLRNQGIVATLAANSQAIRARDLRPTTYYRSRVPCYNPITSPVIRFDRELHCFEFSSSILALRRPRLRAVPRNTQVWEALTCSRRYRRFAS